MTQQVPAFAGNHIRENLKAMHAIFKAKKGSVAFPDLAELYIFRVCQAYSLNFD